MITVHDFLKTLDNGQRLIISVNREKCYSSVVYKNNKLIDVYTGNELGNFDDFIIECICGRVESVSDRYNGAVDSCVYNDYFEKDENDKEDICQYEVHTVVKVESFILIVIHE